MCIYIYIYIYIYLFIFLFLQVYTLYSLATQQLSKQDHYDFGLRGMVALLRYAGRKRRDFPNLPDDEVHIKLL